MTRIALIDRPWLGYRSVMLATPLTAAPIERVRAVFAEFLRRHPEAPLSCRVDGTRWAPVDDVEAHLDRVLRPAPDPDDLEAHVAAHGAAPADLPFVATLSPTSVMINGAHVLGDAVTLAQLLLAVATADPDAFAAIGDRARTADALRALARGLPGHGRGWLDHARHPVAPPAVRPVPTVVPPAPAFAGTVLDQAALRAITKWRNANARGVSLTGVLASLAHRALTAHGIPVAGDGLYALVDIRGAVPGPRFGNLAKALYLPARLDDPAAVSAALSAATDSRRAVPATVAGLRPQAPPSDVVATPLVLTFNSLPTLPGVADLPWTVERGRRFYGFGESHDGAGVTLFALRMRDHMQLTASFDARSAEPAAVRAALADLAQPAEVLSAGR